MAGRHFNQFLYSLEKAPVNIYAIALGAAGGSSMVLQAVAPDGTVSTAPAGGFKGVKSISRTADGDFTFTFHDTYQRLLGVTATVLSVDGTNAPTANAFYLFVVDTKAAGGATVRLRTYLATIGTPVQPTANSRWYFNFQFSNSTAS